MENIKKYIKKLYLDGQIERAAGGITYYLQQDKDNTYYEGLTDEKLGWEEAEAENIYKMFKESQKAAWERAWEAAKAGDKQGAISAINNLQNGLKGLVDELDIMTRIQAEKNARAK